MPIFDQGYQHWTGRLSGHATRWLAITRHGVRALSSVRMVRLLMLLAWLPAIALVAFLALWGLLEQRSEAVLGLLRNILPREIIASPQEFRSAVWTVAYSFFFRFELFAAVLIVLVVGPGLVSRDLRFNAFPLYFSRPLRRIDYFFGKWGVIAAFLAAVVIVPAVAAYLIGLAFSLDLKIIGETHRVLWGSILHGLVIAVSAGTLMLALSSLSRRSIYVGLAWAGFCILTLMISGILIGLRIGAESRRVVDDAIAKWVAENPPPPGITLRGSVPIPSRVARPGGARTAEDDERDRWMGRWSEQFNRAHGRAMAEQQDSQRNDWRPIVGYTNNLTRIGDWLLDTDRAWVTFGRAIEGTRSRLGPAAQMQAGGRLPREVTGPANDRLFADRLLWQFPVWWSFAALAGLWLLSVAVLRTRVKSLDRLK